MSTLTLTVRQATFLLQAGMGMKTPDKVGDRTFSDGQRATMNDRFRLLARELKRHSPLWKKYREELCGPEECWSRRDLTDAEREHFVKRGLLFKKAVFDEVDVDREIEIDLSGNAAKAVFWALFQWSHPASALCQSGGFMDDVVWPVAEKLGKAHQLREFIGLTKQDDIALKDDSEYEVKEKPNGAAAPEKVEAS